MRDGRFALWGVSNRPAGIIISMKIVSWNGHTEINDGVNFTAVMQKSYGLPPLEAITAERHQAAPVITAVRYGANHTLPPLQISIEDTDNADALRTRLHQWFDGKNGQARPLVIADDDSGRERVIYALPTSLVQIDGAAGYAFAAILQPDGYYDPDYRYRDATAVTELLTLAASGQLETIHNDGEDVVNPTVRLTPTEAQTGQYTYKRWIPIVWRSPYAASNHPVELTNGGWITSTLVTAGKMQADGDDVMVQRDGQAISRFISGMNTSATKIWTFMSFQPAQSGLLAEAIPSSGDIEYIKLTGTASFTIENFPSSGILLIDDEAFLYTGKINSTKQFTGITRAAHGTAAAAHTTTDTAYWIQHSVYVLYGNPTAVYNLAGSEFAPVFDLAASTNSYWVYTLLGVEGLDRAGWGYYRSSRLTYFYSDTPPVAGPTTSPWPWAGIAIEYTKTNNPSFGELIITNACGISQLWLTSGHLYLDSAFTIDDEQYWQAGFYRSGTLIEAINAPTPRDTFVSWTPLVDCTDENGRGAPEVRAQLQIGGVVAAHFQAYMGIGGANLTLDNTQTPVVAMGVETNNYSLDLTITYVGSLADVSANAVVDGSFESGTDNWSDAPGGWLTRQNTDVYAGSYALLIGWYGDSLNEDNYVLSPYVAVPRSGALVSFAAKPGASGLGVGSVWAQWLTGSGGSVVSTVEIGFPSGSDWAVRQKVLQKPTSANGLRLLVGQYGAWGGISDPARGAYFDSFMVLPGDWVEPLVGDGLYVQLSMQLDETLEIDTSNGRVVYLADHSLQGQAVTPIGQARQYWLPLAAGYTTLKFTGAAIADIEVEVEFYRRYYH